MLPGVAAAVPALPTAGLSRKAAGVGPGEVAGRAAAVGGLRAAVAMKSSTLQAGGVGGGS